MDRNFVEMNDMRIVYKDKKAGHIPPPNYRVDPLAPHIFIPELPPCVHRRPTKERPKGGCFACPSFKPLICDKFVRGVTAYECSKCPYTETPPIPTEE